MKNILNKKNILLILMILLTILGFNYLNNPLLAFRYILLYLIIMFGSISISFIFKKSISQSVPIYFLFTFVFLYVFGIFNFLIIGLYAFIILNVIIDCIVLYSIIKNKKINEFKELVIVPSSIVYTILFFLFAMSTRNAAFAVWDEFTFWSIATKNMYYSDSLYLNSSTTLFNGGYPPCPTMIEYFFCKVLGKYSQGIELFAYQMFGFSLFLPFFKNNSKKNIVSTLCITLSILFIPAIFIEGYFYSTIYADSILGILIGYFLYEVFTSNDDNFLLLTIFLSLFTITATKSMGIVISAILLLILFLNYMIDIKNKKLNMNKFKIIFLSVSSIVISFISWKYYVKSSDVVLNYGYTNNIKYGSIIDMIKNIYFTFIGAHDGINTTFQTFFSDFFDKACYSNMPFGMTASCWITIFMVIYILVYKFLIKNDEKEKYKKAFCLIALSAIIYIILLQVAYYTQFSPKEAMIHASIHRYVGTIFIAILMFIIGLIFNKIDIKLFIIVPILLLPFTPISVISNATITSGINNYNSQNNLSYIKDFASFVTTKVDSTSKIFPVHQTQNEDSLLLQFRYFMTPYQVIMTDMFNDDKEYRHKKFNSKEELEKELYDKFDYVVVLNSDEYFIKNYSELFKESNVIDWTLYKVIKDNGKVILKKVN